VLDKDEDLTFKEGVLTAQGVELKFPGRGGAGGGDGPLNSKLCDDASGSSWGSETEMSSVLTISRASPERKGSEVSMIVSILQLIVEF